MNTRIVATTIAMVLILSLSSVGAAPPAWAPKQIMEIQKDLKALGYTCHCNGKMDQPTVEAVKQFQRDHGLKVDGMCTPELRKAITDAWEAKVRAVETALGKE